MRTPQPRPDLHAELMTSLHLHALANALRAAEREYAWKEEVGDFILRQVLERDAIFFGG